MRVHIINICDNIGGAAVAARRLMEALNTNGVQAVSKQYTEVYERSLTSQTL